MEGFHVENKPGDDGSNVRSIPNAIGVGFSHADVAVVGAAFEEFFPVVDFDTGAHFALRVTKLMDGTVRVFHSEFFEWHFVEES